jgi:ABC-type amino acid transport substrate-binding protein
MTRAGGRAGMVLAVAMVAACGPTVSTSRQGPAPGAGMIRVGTSPDAPPVSFVRNGRFTGIEPDLAQSLADQLRRPVQLIPMRWDELVPSLLRGNIDIIMSGMTVTAARQVRVAFSDPYLQSGLVPVVRRDSAGKYDNLAAIRDASANVGVRTNSTAERWVRDNLNYATVVPYPNLEDASRELAQGRLDMFVTDIPIAAWMVSQHEGDIQLVRIRLTHEDIAWGFRPGDTQLRAAANAALARWRQDGTLRAILQRWIPYLSDLERWR